MLTSCASMHFHLEKQANRIIVVAIIITNHHALASLSPGRPTPPAEGWLRLMCQGGTAAMWVLGQSSTLIPCKGPGQAFHHCTVLLCRGKTRWPATSTFSFRFQFLLFLRFLFALIQAGQSYCVARPMFDKCAVYIHRSRRKHERGRTPSAPRAEASYA